MVKYTNDLSSFCSITGLRCSFHPSSLLPHPLQYYFLDILNLYDLSVLVSSVGGTMVTKAAAHLLLFFLEGHSLFYSGTQDESQCFV